MSIRYGNKVSPLASRKSSFFKKNRYDRDAIGDVVTVNSWTRPVDWLTMPTITPAEQKIALLVQVFPQGSNFLAFTVTGNYTVDWGDGTSENVANGVKAQHEYTYTDPDLNATVTSDGYKMAIVVITPQAGQNLTSVNFNQLYTLSGSTFPNSSPILEVLLSCPNLIGLNIGATSTTNVFCKSLVNFSGINMGNLTSFANLFQFLTNLKNISFGTIGTITSTAAMFNGCISLIYVPLFDTSAVTNMGNMFNGCKSIVWIPQFNTASVTTTSYMFYDCYSLTTVPLFNTSLVTDMSRMFGFCSSLKSVPAFNTGSATTMAFMFTNCLVLKSVPLFDTSLVTNMSQMFTNCSSLVAIPLFDTSAVTNMSNMFNGCISIKSIPRFITTAATNMSYMFANCESLTSIPFIDTSNVTSMDSMFSGCNSLESVPQLDTSSVTNMSSMFMSCYKLVSIPYPQNLGFGPIFDTSSVTTMNRMFDSCVSLTTVPPLDTSSVTIMTNMFLNCTSLKTVPLFNTAAVTDMTGMFSGCYSLVGIPALNTAAVTDMNGMFQNCLALVAAPLSGSLIAGAGVDATKFNNTFQNCPSLTRASLSGAEMSISFAGCKLSKTELESIFTNLDTEYFLGSTITITGNWGAPTPISLAGTTTAKNVVISMPNTSGIQVGMQVTGTNTPLTTGSSVNFNAGSDLVEINNHGLSNGDMVSFPTINSTTGITIDTIYYIINATANDFQVAATVGGSALPLTTSGPGTLRYISKVISIIPNVSVTMSRPMAASGNVIGLTFQQLTTGIALMKGWTVTS